MEALDSCWWCKDEDSDESKDGLQFDYCDSSDDQDEEGSSESDVQDLPVPRSRRSREIIPTKRF